METRNNHNKELIQLALWDELVQVISFSRDLSVAYHNSVKCQRSDINELLNAIRTSNVQGHVILNKIIDCFMTPVPDDDANNALSDGEIRSHESQENVVISVSNKRRSRSPNCQLKIVPNECTTRKPQYRSISPIQLQMPSSKIEQRSDTRKQYQSETIYQPQSRNLNRSPPNSSTPIQFRQFKRSPHNSPAPQQFKQFNKSPTNFHTSAQSQHVNWSSSNAYNPTQYKVRNRSRSRSRSQDQQKFVNRSMHSSVTRQRSKYRSHSKSPPRFRTQHGRGKRSHSRSYNEQRFDSKSTNYYKKRQSRTRKRSRSKSQSKSPPISPPKSPSKSPSKSPNRKENVTENQPLSQSNMDPLSSSPTTVKKKREHHRTPRNKLWKMAKLLSTYNPQSTEQPLMPGINPGTIIIPPPQDPYQVPRPYYNPLNAPGMYYPQPTHMPRLMRPPYFMPPRPRIPYPPTYPRMYRPPFGSM